VLRNIVQRGFSKRVLKERSEELQKIPPIPPTSLSALADLMDILLKLSRASLSFPTPS